MKEQSYELSELLPPETKTSSSDSSNIFIFLGKTQAGKTTVINILCNSDKKLEESINHAQMKLQKSKV